jgi:pimeloyl-ACP methyl ester carboxylesterase
LPVTVHVTPPLSPATATVLPDYTRPTPAAPVDVAIRAADNVELAAAYYAPVVAAPVAGEGAPGILLVHMLDGSRLDWDPFARELQSNGFAVLALDLRGYGNTPGPADWDAAVGDVAAAWRNLRVRPEVDYNRTAIVGASIGGNLALIVGSNNPDINAVVALSPGEDYRGLRPTGLLPNFDNRPVLLIASQDDPQSYAAAQEMDPALEAGETYYYLDAGHGTEMFTETDLNTRLLSWLAVKLGEAKG